MASLSELYQPAQSAPLGFVNEALNRSAGTASEDAGLSMARQQRQFETRTVPDLTHEYAARGTFYSGQFGNAVDRAKEDYTNSAGDTQRLLDRHLSDLARQRILSSLGVSI